MSDNLESQNESVSESLTDSEWEDVEDDYEDDESEIPPPTRGLRRSPAVLNVSELANITVNDIIS
jgi:hypothetical protein